MFDEDKVEEVDADALLADLRASRLGPSYAYGNQLPRMWGINRDGHTLACKRYPVRKLMAYDADGNLNRESPRNRLPLKYVEMYEQNQQIASCCRHPENGEIEAWYSSPEDAEKGIPDVYLYFCGGCGRRHVRFCVGGGERPFWEVH